MDIAEKPTGAIRCDACPVLCYINPGRTGACDRYANDNGQLVRIDPHVVLDRAVSRGDSVVPFLDRDREWDGSIVTGPENFVTAIGAGTTYPDYKPAPFIISSTVQGVDMVTVVTEGIFSYCGVKVKIDTDRHLGPETNLVRAQGEPVGTRHHQRIWFANAFARRCAPPDRRQPQGRHGDLRNPAEPVRPQAGGTYHR